MTTLKQRILSYFQRNPGKLIASGEIQRLVQQKTIYTPSNATRRLRELAQDGFLTVKQVKGHAHYKLASEGQITPNKGTLELQATLQAMSDYWNSIPEKV